jgi:hypothetical protein
MTQILANDNGLCHACWYAFGHGNPRGAVVDFTAVSHFDGRFASPLILAVNSPSFWNFRLELQL